MQAQEGALERDQLTPWWGGARQAEEAPTSLPASHRQAESRPCPHSGHRNQNLSPPAARPAQLFQASEQQAQPPTSRQLEFAVPVLPWRKKATKPQETGGQAQTTQPGEGAVEGDRTRPAKRAGPAPTFQPPGEPNCIRAMLSMQSPTSRGPDQRRERRVSSGPSAPRDHQPSPKPFKLCLRDQQFSAESLGQSKQIPRPHPEAPWVHSNKSPSLLEIGASCGPGL